MVETEIERVKTGQNRKIKIRIGTKQKQPFVWRLRGTIWSQ